MLMILLSITWDDHEQIKHLKQLIAQGICEAIGLKKILYEIEIRTNYTIRLYCDNKAVISITKNPFHNDRTKHVKIYNDTINIDHVSLSNKTLTS